MSIYTRNEPKQHFKTIGKSFLRKHTPALVKRIYHHLKRRTEEVETPTPPNAL